MTMQAVQENTFQKAVLYLINKTFSTISVKKRKVIEFLWDVINITIKLMMEMDVKRDIFTFFYKLCIK